MFGWLKRMGDRGAARAEDRWPEPTLDIDDVAGPEESGAEAASAPAAPQPAAAPPEPEPDLSDDLLQEFAKQSGPKPRWQQLAGEVEEVSADELVQELRALMQGI